MQTIAVANQKGGVGKTTTATNVAAGLAIRGYRTLLIDLDSQCNATYTFLGRDTITNTLANVLIGTETRCALLDAIYETSITNLDLAPSHIRLAMLDRMIAIDEQYRLKNALLSVASEYEVVLIDCPPSLGMTLTSALLAATHVLVPVAAQFYPLEGVVDLKVTIEAATQPNPNLKVLGYVMTDFDSRARIAGEAHEKVKEMFGDAVFETVIRSNVKLQTAPSYQESIYEHAPASNGARDYGALTDEIVQRLRLNQPLRLVQAETAG